MRRTRTHRTTPYRFPFAALGALAAACLFGPIAAARAEEVPAERGAVDSLVVDEVQLDGVTVFTQDELEKILEVAPGEAIERAKIVQTAKNIQELYRIHGYEEVRIRTQLVRKASAETKKPENALDIVVNEGAPTRISNVEVVFSDPAWQERLRHLNGRLGLKVGDIFDQEKLANGYRSLQDGINSYDFVSVKVSNAEVTQVPVSEVAADPLLLANTARWVKLRVQVDLGERVTFGFQGNVVFAPSQLQAIVDEQKMLGYSKDYLQRIQARVEDEYRKLGYDAVRLDMLTFEKQDRTRHVTYVIDEGPRILIENVSFDGNLVFSNATLEKRFDDVSAGAVSRGYYVAKEVEKTGALVVEWMKSQGYLSAKLASIGKGFNAKGDHVSLVFYVYEGEQTVTRSIEYRGLKALDSDAVDALLGIKEGTPLNLFAFSEGVERVKAAYREKGYLDVRVRNEGGDTVIRYSQENRQADILLDLEEGTQYRVGDVLVEGLTKTREKVVRRELTFKAGDLASEPKILESEARLRKLGIFATANIRLATDERDPTRKTVRIVLEEGTPGLIAGGAGVRNDLGIRLFSQLGYANLWGKNHTLSVTATANRRLPGLGADFCPNDGQVVVPGENYCFIEYDVTIGYLWPWFMLGETNFRPRVSLERTQYRKFDANTASFAASLERQLFAKPNVSGALTYSLESIEQYNTLSTIDNQKIRIGALTPSLTLDLRDNPLLPSRGLFSTASFEIARPLLLAQSDPVPIAYTRFQTRNDLYFRLPKDTVLYLSGRLGLEYNQSKAPPGDPNPQRYAIPLIKQFALGGVGSLRGFREQSLVIPEDIALNGYASYVNYRAQIDLPFAGAMHFGPFVDAANLNWDNFSFGHLRYGVGFGFRYRSPVGPVNFDIGFNPVRNPGEDEYRIHFSIGNM